MQQLESSEQMRKENEEKLREVETHLNSGKVESKAMREQLEAQKKECELKRKELETVLQTKEVFQARIADLECQVTEDQSFSDKLCRELEEQKEIFEEKLEELRTQSLLKIKVEYEQRILDLQAKLNIDSELAEDMRRSMEQQMKEYSSRLEAMKAAELYNVKQDYETKISHLEIQLKSDKEELHKQKQEYETRLNELQKALSQRVKEFEEKASPEHRSKFSTLTTEEKIVARRVYLVWKNYKFNSLKNELLSSSIFLKEANALSTELQKHVTYQFTILTDTAYTPIPISIATETDVDRAGEPVTLSSALSSTLKGKLGGPLVAVDVKDNKHGASHKWSLLKLRQRLVAMKSAYHTACSSEAPIPSSSLCQPGEDPFYDRCPWFQLVGRSFVYLTNILVGTPLLHKVAIVNDNGEVRGHITVSVRLVLIDEMDEKSNSVLVNFEGFGEDEKKTSGHKVVGQDSENHDNSNRDTSGMDLFFKPIKCEMYPNWESLETDEEKGNVELRPSVLPLKPVPLNKPTLCLNDLAFSPIDSSLCNSYLSDGANTPSAFKDFSLSVEKMRSVSKSSSLSSSRCGSPGSHLHRESESQLQKLQMKNKAPSIGGKYCTSIQPGSHVIEGSKCTFRVTILQVIGVPQEFTDVFVQFRFLHTGSEMSFSTEPLRNENSDLVLGFYHMENIVAPVSKGLIKYLQSTPLLLEVFGHYQQHPLHRASTDSNRFSPLGQPLSSASSPLPPSRFTSSPRTVVSESTGSTHVCSKVDILAYFEVCELSPSGLYTPSSVNHTVESVLGGSYMLQQGVQRRLRVTFIYEQGTELHLTKVNEIVIGRVRSTLNVSTEVEQQSKILSLPSFPSTCSPALGDKRIFYQFEAAWDSSLHNSILLNRVTPQNDLVYFTISIYMELEKGIQPACFTKDLCVTIHGRDSRPTAPRSIFSIFTGRPQPQDDKCVGIYELVLKKGRERTPPDHLGPVMDKSGGGYFRGEEGMRGWRPRRESLIVEHREQLLRLDMIEETEKTRHRLQVQEKIMEGTKANTDIPLRMPTDQELSKLSDEHKALLAQKCVTLLARRRAVQQQQTTNNDSSSRTSSPYTTPTGILKRDTTSTGTLKRDTTSTGTLKRDTTLTGALKKDITRTGSLKRASRALQSPPMYVPEVHERTGALLNPVAYKGFLSLKVKDDDIGTWQKRYVVVRKPYVIIYENERDAVAWGIINLSTSKIHYADRTAACTFSVCTKYTSFVIQTAKDKELSEWLYVLDPMLAGSIKAHHIAANKKTVPPL